MSRAVKLALITAPLIVGAGFLMGQLSNSGYGNLWFDRLVKPALMPPGWAFGAAWSAIYLLMGVAIAIILAKPEGRARNRAVTLFLVQLALNYSWSPIFFGLHQVQLGLIVILALLAVVIATALAFAKITRTAAWLLSPYILWLCFAAYLNLAILRLNQAA